MTVYVRAHGITGTPVVTLAGEDVGQVKDIVFDVSTGGVRCFTLAGRGLLAGPLRRALLWRNVHGLGPHAVMVRDGSALEEDDTAARSQDKKSAGANVLGLVVTTHSGVRMGTVGDAVIATGRTPTVVGYEVETDDHRHVLVPVAEPVAVSGERILVPDASAEHGVGDLGGFGAALDRLRSGPGRASRED
ncbi:PRC-barrel domain-containing protein [Streptomyces griseorubiginosus]|uniref:PRC-barrel domain-containing protein n=1 Tax=Streptomyces griseorubiginosus TaxID=67304 RepID=UPI0036D0295B